MSDEGIKKFLAQFEAARKNVESWPQWMQDSAKESAASFPRSDESLRKSKQPSDDRKRAK